ncbi:organic hydroperoxide resistance protein [Microlunatus ginsengisoli]
MNVPDKIVYTAVATSVGGRRGGRAATDDGLLDVQLTAPKELGGPGTGTNPEQLFAAGYAACFNSAVLRFAKEAGVEAKEASVTANVGFGPEGGGFGLTVDLEVAVPGVDVATAQQLVDAAHEVCPYSKAVRGNVPVTARAVAA